MMRTMRPAFGLWTLALLALVGCGQFPNPNDVAAALPEDRAEIAANIMQSVATSLDYKVGHRQISDAQRNELLKEEAENLLKLIDPERVPAADAYRYADLLRMTDRWPEALKSLQTAVKVASTQDRKVNDTLRLAQAQAKTDDVAKALETARSVFGVDPEDRAPILPSVLYELVPAAQGKGKDVELAALLADAIKCHESTRVDEKSDAGRIFLIAARTHIRKAQAKIAELSANGRA